MQRKIRVALLFGGKSAEHEVSLRSAKNIIDALDREKYEPILIGIDKKGIWHICDSEKYLHNAEDPKFVSLLPSEDLVTLTSKDKKGELVSFSGKKTPSIDVIFPVLHGTYGEDGTMQGLLKLADIPFVGAGVLGSAIGMDKDVMKRLLRDAAIPIAKFLCVRINEEMSFEKTVKELGLPLFIKPVSSGSSVGVTKVKSADDWENALKKAFKYDRKILIEEFISAKEVECSIIGNDSPIASVPGEIVSYDEFYTYDAKYVKGKALYKIPLKAEKAVVERIQNLAIEAYQVLCCEGLARIDMFLKESGDVIMNEINTIPGFTNTSVFPMLWEASGVSLTKITDQLIQLALDRYEKEKTLKTNFEEIHHTSKP